jgi:tetratricopeptide (TPR) repeat protein
MKWWTRGLQLADEIGERGYSARIYVNIGTNEFRQGHLDSALLHFVESARRLREASDVVAAAEALGRAGEVLLRQGDLAGARKLLEERYVAVKQAGDQTALALGAFGLGELTLAEGRLAEARARFLEAAQVAERTGRQAVVAGCLIALGAAIDDADLGLRIAAAGYSLAEGSSDFKGLWDPVPAVNQKLSEHRIKLGPLRAKLAWDTGAALTVADALAQAATLSN